MKLPINDGLVLACLALLVSFSVQAKDFEEAVATVTEHTVLFDLDKSEISKDGIKKLRAADVRGRVEIVGRTDSRASEAYNVALGLRRAIAVQHVLGLDDASVSSVGEQEVTGNHGLDRNVTITVTTMDLVFNPIYGGYDVVYGPIHHLQWNTIPK